MGNDKSGTIRGFGGSKEFLSAAFGVAGAGLASAADLNFVGPTELMIGAGLGAGMGHLIGSHLDNAAEHIQNDAFSLAFSNALNADLKAMRSAVRSRYNSDREMGYVNNQVQAQNSSTLSLQRAKENCGIGSRDQRITNIDIAKLIPDACWKGIVLQEHLDILKKNGPIKIATVATNVLFIESVLKARKSYSEEGLELELDFQYPTGLSLTKGLDEFRGYHVVQNVDAPFFYNGNNFASKNYRFGLSMSGNSTQIYMNSSSKYIRPKACVFIPGSTAEEAFDQQRLLFKDIEMQPIGFEDVYKFVTNMPDDYGVLKWSSLCGDVETKKLITTRSGTNYVSGRNLLYHKSLYRQRDFLVALFSFLIGIWNQEVRSTDKLICVRDKAFLRSFSKSVGLKTAIL